MNRSAAIRELMNRSLSLSRLDAFRLFAEFGTIKEAAGGDVNRQNQFSRQITELEEALETNLVHRSRGRLSLTPEGKELARLTQAFFDGLLDVQQAEAGFEHYRLVAGASVLQGLLIPRIRRLHLENPNASFSFTNRSTQDSLKGLVGGVFDLGVYRGETPPQQFERHAIGTMTFVAVCPKERCERSPRWKTFLGLPMVLLSGSGRFASRLGEQREGVGASSLVMRVSSFPDIASIIRSGIAVGIVPEWFVDDFPKESFHQIRFKELQEFEQDLWLIYDPQAAIIRPKIERMAQTLSSVLKGN